MPKQCVGCAVAQGKKKYSTAQCKKENGLGTCIVCAAKLKVGTAAATSPLCLLAPYGEEIDGAGSNGAPAHASGGGGDEEFENPCPICLDNENDAIVDWHCAGICLACGQMFCGLCHRGGLAEINNCPTCRAPCIVSDEESFKRAWKLVHDRSPGRYTAHAQSALATAYDNGEGVTQNQGEAIKWYTRAALRGYQWAQHNLAFMYDEGQGVEKDGSEAAKWWLRAAQQGLAPSQNSLASMYIQGRGVKQDYAEAIKWYQCAAEQGYARAQFNLGVMHEQGKGVKQDYAEAIKWYRCAATQGVVEAQYNLASMYKQGKCVKQDYAEAIKWYRCAVEQGYAGAQNSLALLLYYGNCVKQDFAEALQLLQLAAEQGNVDALGNLDKMQRNNRIPIPPPGTAVTTILLTSAKATKYNNRTGKVVIVPKAEKGTSTTIKRGRVAVLLNGEQHALAFNLKNLKL